MIFFSVLGACLVALAVTLNVSWIVLNWREGILAVLGFIFFMLIIAGLVLNTIFLVREIRRNEQHDSFINAVTHELKTPIASMRLYLQTLQTRDVDGAKAFYESVFGWTTSDQEFGGITYTIGNVGDTGIAGMMTMQAGVPEEAPAFWLTYFAVEDADAAVAKVQELGGSVTMPPMDLAGVGRLAVVADPHGAQFGLIKGEPPEE